MLSPAGSLHRRYSGAGSPLTRDPLRTDWGSMISETIQNNHHHSHVSGSPTISASQSTSGHVSTSRRSNKCSNAHHYRLCRQQGRSIVVELLDRHWPLLVVGWLGLCAVAVLLGLLYFQDATQTVQHAMPAPSVPSAARWDTGWYFPHVKDPMQNVDSLQWSSIFIVGVGIVCVSNLLVMLLFCMALRSEVVLVPMLESELAVSILTPVSSFCSPKTVSQQLHERNKANFRRRRTSQSGCVGSSSLANLHTLNNTQGIRTTTKSIVGALMRSPSAPNLASICQTMNESMVFSSA